MLQKLLRIIALCLLITLVFSPIYSKHLKHYFMSFKLINSELENITDIGQGNEDLCNIKGKIKIPASDHRVQILHIVSTNCKACIDDIPIWNQFPEELYKHLMVNKYKSKVDIINLVDDKSNKDIIIQLAKPTIGKNKLEDVNVSLCVGLISHDEIKAMNIDLLPITLIVKNGSIAHAISRQIYTTDLDQLSSIVSSVVK